MPLVDTTVTCGRGSPPGSARAVATSGRAGMPATTTSCREAGRCDKQRACRDPAVSHEPASPGQRAIVGRAGCRKEPLEERACRTHEGERRQDGDLGRELGRLRGDQKRREEPDAHRVHDTRHATLRDRHRVGDHEEEEDQDLGRRDEQPPERPTRDRVRGAIEPSSSGRSPRALRSRLQTRARSRRR